MNTFVKCELMSHDCRFKDKSNQWNSIYQWLHYLVEAVLFRFVETRTLNIPCIAQSHIANY